MSGAATSLRLLSVAEIFDRAVVLYVRNFISITGIEVIVVALPYAFASYFLAARFPTEWDPVLYASQFLVVRPSLLIRAGIVIILAQIACSVLVRTVAFAQSGKETALSDAVCSARTSLALSLKLLALESAGAAFVTVALAIFLLPTIPLTEGVIGSLPFTFRALVAGPVAIVLACGVLFALGLLSLVFVSAVCASVVEGLTARSSMELTVRRLCAHDAWQRTAVMAGACALSLLGLYFAWTFVSYLLFLVLYQFQFQSTVIIYRLSSTSVSLVLWTITLSLLTTACMLHYFDLRNRHEGLDIETAIRASVS
jgi:hypothetical protein